MMEAVAGTPGADLGGGGGRVGGLRLVLVPGELEHGDHALEPGRGLHEVDRRVSWRRSYDVPVDIEDALAERLEFVPVVVPDLLLPDQLLDAG